MALQSSGAISINDIRTELGETTGSLRSLSATAGFSSPDAISEFYGYSAATGPSVTTNAATSVTVTSVTLNGNVTSDGGSTVTARGFYFGTNSNATSNPTYGSGSGTGAFSLNRTGLVGSTTYYFAAYATNASGTTVGSTLSFTTQAAVTLVNRCSSTLTIYGYSVGPLSLSSFNVSNGYGQVRNRIYAQVNHPNYGWTNILYKDNSYGFGSDSSVAAQRTYGDSGYTYNTVQWQSDNNTSNLVQNRVYLSATVLCHSYAAGYNVTVPAARRAITDNNSLFNQYSCTYTSGNGGFTHYGSTENSTFGNWISGTYGKMNGNLDSTNQSYNSIYDSFSFNGNVTSSQQYLARNGYHEKRIYVD